MIFLIFLIFLFAGCSSPVGYNHPNAYNHIKVTKVIDGDTVRLSNGKLLRYIGLDTPEVRIRKRGRFIYDPQPFSLEAKEMNRKLVENKFVRVEFDVEKLDNDSSMLVHHFKEYSWWESIIVDESPYASFHYSVHNDNNQLYIVYSKPTEENVGEILFSQTGLVTKTNHYTNYKNFNIKLFPNPFNNKINIQFVTEKTNIVSVKIYDYSGKLIKTILKKRIKKGKYNYSWDGTDNRNIIISNGNYILRIRAGNRIMSRPLSFIN